MIIDDHAGIGMSETASTDTEMKRTSVEAAAEAEAKKRIERTEKEVVVAEAGREVTDIIVAAAAVTAIIITVVIATATVGIGVTEVHLAPNLRRVGKIEETNAREAEVLRNNRNPMTEQALRNLQSAAVHRQQRLLRHQRRSPKKRSHLNLVPTPHPLHPLRRLPVPSDLPLLPLKILFKKKRNCERRRLLP